MAISFNCPCGQHLTVPPNVNTDQVTCPRCGQVHALPTRLEPAPAPPRRPRRDRWDDEGHRGDAPYGPTVPNGKAKASLILGILSLFVGLLFGILAIVFGILANREIRRSGGRQYGEGQALAGIILGAFSFVATGLMIALLLPAVSRVREAAERAQSQNNLKEMAIGVIRNADENNGKILDEAAIHSPLRKPLLSWRVAILPQIDQGTLYQQFHLDEPWDSTHNQQFITRMPKVFAHPAFKDEAAKGLTPYRALVGPGTGFARGSRYPASFTDGVSQTMMLVEAEEHVPWTKPDELVYNPQGPLPRFSTRSKAGFSAAMWDASVRTVLRNVSEPTLRGAITASGGEVLGPDW